jgi:hypothetical protein
MSDRKCNSNPSANQKAIASFADEEILEAVEHHADPSWWKEPHIVRENQAYLKRWGAYLRREARRRGLM